MGWILKKIDSFGRLLWGFLSFFVQRSVSCAAAAVAGIFVSSEGGTQKAKRV